MCCWRPVPLIFVRTAEKGEVYTWGWGGNWLTNCGALGHGSYESQGTPKLVEGLADVKITQICCGTVHTIALAADGKVVMLAFSPISG
jgi:alpha-tubulin suppressor-like RCC1 family protein